jgi:hypothetical protein
MTRYGISGNDRSAEVDIGQALLVAKVLRVLKSVLLRFPVMVSEVTVPVFMWAEVRAAESSPGVAT